MMKQEEAKKEILNKWLKLSENEKYNEHCEYYFHDWLKKNSPDLLSFKAVGGKYETINGWVLTWQNIYQRR